MSGESLGRVSGRLEAVEAEKRLPPLPPHTCCDKLTAIRVRPPTREVLPASFGKLY
jgi:hypothetical protein